MPSQQRPCRPATRWPQAAHSPFPPPAVGRPGRAAAVRADNGGLPRPCLFVGLDEWGRGRIGREPVALTGWGGAMRIRLRGRWVWFVAAAAGVAVGYVVWRATREPPVPEIPRPGPSAF